MNKVFRETWARGQSPFKRITVSGRPRWKSTSSSVSSSDNNITTTNTPSKDFSELWQSPSVVDVSPLANQIRQEVRRYAQNSQTPNIKLVGLLSDVGPYRWDSELYSERIAETLQEDGIHYELWRCDNHDHSPEGMGAMIRKANQQEDIHGILVFYPIFPFGPRGPYKNKISGVYYKTHDDFFRYLVDPTKDVEGLCGTRWYHTKFECPVVYPCTARSVQTILEHFHLEQGMDWSNQVVSVVNRSEIVGRPLAAMLASCGATVYSIDANSVLRFNPNGRLHRCAPSRTLQDCLTQSNVVVTGVPDPNFQIETENLAAGTTVVNVSEFTNVDEESLLERPDIKYIPQVGKVTVAVLEQNLIRLHRQAVKCHS